MLLKCIIIDDEPLAIDVIARYIAQTSYLTLAGKYTNPVKAFEYLAGHKTDLLFVDIQMPDLSGLELVRNLDFQPAVIFTTAYAQYAIEGFQVDAIDYLLKPVDYPEFLKAAEKAKRWIYAKNKVSGAGSGHEFLFVKSGHKIIRIQLDSIKYIEGMSEYVRIHQEKGKPLMTLLSLKAIEGQLPEDQFMRVHKSYIVNLHKIAEIESQSIICNDGAVIPVSKLYREKLQEYIGRNFMM
jgi:DNA-binding LytR/AlgR family response regulator